MGQNIYKKISELAAWDLDAGCRDIVDQSTRSRRKLKKKIRRNDRKRLDRYAETCYNDDTKGKEG